MNLQILMVLLKMKNTPALALDAVDKLAQN